MDNITCLTCNAKGLESPLKRRKVLNQLKEYNCAVAMLQETHLSEKEHMKLRREWVEQQYSSSDQNGKKRVAILFNRSIYFCREKLSVTKREDI